MNKIMKYGVGIIVAVMCILFTNVDAKANFTVIFDGVPYEFLSTPESDFCMPIGDDMYGSNGVISDIARIKASHYALSRARTKYGWINDGQVYVVSGTDLMLAQGCTEASLSKASLKEARQIAARTAAEAKAAHEAYLARKAAGLTIEQVTQMKNQ